MYVARPVVALGVTALLAVLSGCERRETELETGKVAPEPEGRGGGPQTGTVPLVVAIDRLAEAGCDRAQACGDVRAGGKYDSRENCLRAVSKADADNLGLDQCPKLDAAQLEACTKAVRSAPCKHSGSTLERMGACRVADLCRR